MRRIIKLNEILLPIKPLMHNYNNYILRYNSSDIYDILIYNINGREYDMYLGSENGCG